MILFVVSDACRRLMFSVDIYYDYNIMRYESSFKKNIQIK